MASTTNLVPVFSDDLLESHGIGMVGVQTRADSMQDNVPPFWHVVYASTRRSSCSMVECSYQLSNIRTSRLAVEREFFFIRYSLEHEAIEYGVSPNNEDYVLGGMRYIHMLEIPERSGAGHLMC